MSPCCLDSTTPTLFRGVGAGGLSCGICGNCHFFEVKRKSRWRKILWEKQPYSDSYVDDTFLISLVRNANLARYSYTDLCKNTVVITQHLSCVLIFLSVYRLIANCQLKSRTLLVFDIVALLLGHSLRWYRQPTLAGTPDFLAALLLPS